MNTTTNFPSQSTTSIEMHRIRLIGGEELLLDVIDLGRLDPDDEDSPGLGKPNQDLVAFLDADVAQEPGVYIIRIWSTSVMESTSPTVSPLLTQFSIESFVGYAYDDGTWQIDGRFTAERWKAMYS